jgi:hypothetical protein
MVRSRESITGKLIDGISPYWTIDFKHTIETYNANLSLLHINENSFRLATNPEIILEREKPLYTTQKKIPLAYKT